MKKIKNVLLYIGILSIFLTLIYWIIQTGKTLEPGRNVIEPQSNISYFSEFIQSILLNLAHPVALILAQVVTIIIVSRVFGFIFSKIHQPTVIGEIIAGIAL